MNVLTALHMFMLMINPMQPAETTAEPVRFQVEIYPYGGYYTYPPCPYGYNYWNGSCYRYGNGFYFYYGPGYYNRYYRRRWYGGRRYPRRYYYHGRRGRSHRRSR